MIRVMIVDDHEIVRRGVAELLGAQPDMEIIADVGTRAEALEVVAVHAPDVVLLDIRLDDGNGIDLCREITELHPDSKCLILTAFGGDRAMVDAAEAGASGFAVKQIRGNEIVDSVRRIAGGAVLLDAAEVRMANERLSRSDEGLLENLTARERRIFDLIGEGCSNRQIASELFLAEKTVKNYVSNMLAKLGMERRTEAAALAARLDERQRSG